VRLKIIIPSIVFAGLTVFYFYGISLSIISPRLYSSIENTIYSQKLPIKDTKIKSIKGISTNCINKVFISKIVLEDKFNSKKFTIKKIVVCVNLWNIIFDKSSIEKSISKIYIQKPVIELRNIYDTSYFSNLFAEGNNPKSSFMMPKIYIKNGVIKLGVVKNNLKQNIILKNIYLFLNEKNKNIYQFNFRFSDSRDSGNYIRFKGEYDSSRKIVQSNIKTKKDLSVEKYKIYSNMFFPLGLILKGNVNINLKVFCDFSNNNLLDGLLLNGKVNFSDFNIDAKSNYKRSDKLFNFMKDKNINKVNANISFNGKTVLLKNVSGFVSDMPFNVNGWIKDFRYSDKNIFFELNDCKSESIGKFLNNKILSKTKTLLPSKIRGVIKDEGGAKNIEINMGELNFILKNNLKIKFSGIKINSVDGLFETTPASIDIEKSGSIVLKGYTQNKIKYFSFETQELGLKYLIEGLLNININKFILGETTFVLWNTESGFDCDLNSLVKNLDGFGFVIENRNFVFTKQDNTITSSFSGQEGAYSFDMLAKINDSVLTVSSAFLRMEDVYLDIKGDFPLASEKEFAVSVSGLNIDPAMLEPIIHTQIKYLNKINVQGSVKGKMSNPEIAVVSNFTGDYENKNIKGDLSFNYKNKILSINTFTVNNWMNLQLNYNTESSEGNIAVKANGFPSRLIFDQAENLINPKYFLGIKNIINDDLLDADVNMALNKNNFNGSGALTLYSYNNQEKNETALLNFSIDRKNLEIKNFELNKDNGILFLNSSIKFGDTYNFINSIDLRGYLKQFPVNNIPLSGEITSNVVFDKDKSYKGFFDVNKLMFDKDDFKELIINFSKDKDSFSIDDLILDNELSGNLVINLDDRKQISGELDVHTSRLGNILNKIINKSKIKKNVIIESNVNIRGTALSPIFESNNVKIFIIDQVQKILTNVSFVYENKSFFINKGSMFLNKQKKMNFSGFINLNNNLDLNIKTRMYMFDMQDIKYFLGAQNNFKGVLDGQLNFNLRDNTLIFEPDVSLLQGKIFGIYADHILGSLEYDLNNSSVKFNNLSIKQGKQEFQVKPGSYIDNSNSDNMLIDLNLYFRKWNFEGLFKGFGEANLNLKLDKNSNVLYGILNTNNLWANKYNMKKTRIDFTYCNSLLTLYPVDNKNGFLGTLSFTGGNIVFKELKYLKDNKEIFYLDGMIAKNNKINLMAKASGVPVEVISGIIDFGFMIYGSSDYSVKVSGSLDDPVIHLDMTLKQGNIAGLAYDDAYLTLDVTKDTISIPNLTVIGKDRYNLFAKAEIPFPVIRATRPEVMKRKMNIRITSKDTNLEFLTSLIGEDITKAKGPLALDIRIANTIYDPKISGFIKVVNGTLNLSDGIKQMKDLNVDINIVNSKLSIKRFDTKVGNGKLNVDGNIIFEKFAPKSFDINILTSRDRGIAISLLSLSIPQSTFFNKIIPNVPSRGELKGGLRVFGTSDKYKITGDLTLNNTRFTYPPQKSDKETGSALLDFVSNADLDVKLNTGLDVIYENTFADLEIDGKLNFKGRGDDMLVNGQVDILRGEINYIGHAFTLTSGKFELKNSVPYIELKAETQIQRSDRKLNTSTDDTIVVTVEKAKLADIKPKFSSKNYPDTAPNLAASLAIGGYSEEDMSPEQKDNFVKQEFFRLIDSSLASPVIRSVLRKTGLVDFVDIKTSVTKQSADLLQTQNKTNNNANVQSLLYGSKVEVGKYLNPRVFLSYSLGLEEGAENNLALNQYVGARYKLQNRLYLTGTMELAKDRQGDKQVSMEYQIPLSFKKNKNKAK
jgi:hypothetical protein